MRLMRNVTSDGQCKYALVRMDKMATASAADRGRAMRALAELGHLGLLENPKPGDPEEFFAVKLKDPYAPAALKAYALKAGLHDYELAKDVLDLCDRAGANSPYAKKTPD